MTHQNAASEIAKSFMQSLRKAEETRELKELCELFGENPMLENLTRPSLGKHSTHNHEAKHTSPTAFWRQYLSAFERIESHFTHVTDDGRTAVLEWHSVGCLATGTPVEYNGVSIFEHDNNRISHFRTYYDSAALLPHAAKTEKHYSETVGVPEVTNQASS